jgi:DNA polymerase-3 subunit epsilon/ATP-dependent DNA helicase DinG
LPRTYVALDLETTGLSAEKDAILEVGAVKYQDGVPVEQFESLINPGRPIPFEITLITGIRNEDVIGKPTFDRVAPALRQFAGSAPIVGQNIAFDLGFLRRPGAHGSPLFVENRALDTWELASVLAPGLPSYSLGSLALHFGIASPNGHRALNDASVTAQLFEILRERAALLPRGVLAEIVRLTEILKQWGGQWDLAEVFEEAWRNGGAARDRAGQASEQSASCPPLAQVVPSSALFRAWYPGEPVQPLYGEDAIPPEVDVEALAAMLEPGGVFSDLFPGYEHRAQQVEMLCSVCDAFNQRHHLMAEAGTGTGKSLAYLLPAVAHAVRTGERVVVSTNTINLQDQLFQKDLPDIQAALSRAWGKRQPFRATLLKGRGNYLCAKRFDALRRAGPSTPEEMRSLARILVWLLTTETGDAAELSLAFGADRAVWSRVNAASEGCSVELCARDRDINGRCFFYRARKAADAAHVIVVNHALLMADAALTKKVLPKYNRLIVDEAHHLENAVTDQLSFRTDGSALSNLFNTLYAPGAKTSPRTGLLTEISDALRKALPAHYFTPLHAIITETQGDVQAARSQLENFWQVMEEFVRDALPKAERDEYELKLRITQTVRTQPVWVDVEVAWDNLGVTWGVLNGHIDALFGALSEIAATLEAGAPETKEVERLTGELENSQVRMLEAYNGLEEWIMRPLDNRVYWIEAPADRAGGRSGGMPGRSRAVLRQAPIHVGDLVQKTIFWENDTVILTSATLRTGGSFDYVRERLAAEDADVAFVGSPFDYRSCTLLYLPSDLPEPNAPQFQAVVESSLINLAKALEGRTLALFTSYAQLRRTASSIGPALTAAGITVLSQAAGGSRHQLLETFKTSERTVLLGTRSFWEGVDVVGPALSALVLVRLPFAVPSDPVVAARSETFDDPFHQYQVPDAILRFRQGFGRLIRSKTDRGVVVVLDKRVTSKAYGKLFLESLPECTVQQAPLMNLAPAAKEWVGKS